MTIRDTKENVALVKDEILGLVLLHPKFK